MPEAETAQLQALRDAQAEVRRNREQLIHAGMALKTGLQQTVRMARLVLPRALVPCGWVELFCLGCLLGRRS